MLFVTDKVYVIYTVDYDRDNYRNDRILDGGVYINEALAQEYCDENNALMIDRARAKHDASEVSKIDFIREHNALFEAGLRSEMKEYEPRVFDPSSSNHDEGWHYVDTWDILTHRTEDGQYE